MAEEISREPKIDSVVWLLLFILIKNGKKQSEEGKTENVKFEEKRSIGWRMELSKFCMQGDKHIKNGIKGMVTSGQDPSKLSFQLGKGIKEKLKAGCGGTCL